MVKILVADDNANIQKMVSLAFAERGIEVVAVGNGEAAVRRLPDLKPDLVLADIFMPVRNGYEVCEYVKRDPRFSHTPVILLVGAFDPLDEKEAHRVGADGVLKKPFVPPDPLIAMVTAVLEKNPAVAAELAAAKRAKAEPPSQGAEETQANAPAKISNERTEPAPKASEVTYGYDSGRRKLDPARALPETQAPVSDAEENEEFDGAVTTSDWRRSAMDFEVSEEDANRPAFAVDNLNSAAFPSESVVPPQHVRAAEPAEKIEPVVQERVPEIIETPEVKESSALEAHQFTAKAEDQRAPESAASAKEPEPETRETQAEQAGPAAGSGFASKAAGWIESILPAKYPQGGWLSSITGSATKTESTGTTEAPRVSETLPASHLEEHEVRFQEREPETEAIQASVEKPATESHDAEEDSFFADEMEVGGDEAAPEPSPSFQIAAAPRQVVNLGSDPALIEPPAVRVVPEPLLVDDEPHESSDYGGRREELPPLHSFLVPAPLPVPDARESASEAASENGSNGLPAEVRANAESERIPTGPPPNREALAEIPFLSPPPEFRQAPAQPANGLNPETVDAIVRKVLERLEPQLHEMLSKGLFKPIVENILQNEAIKRDS